MAQSQSNTRPTLAPRLSSGFMAAAKSASNGAFMLAKASMATPPQTPDGLTAAESRAPSDTPTSPSFLAGLWDQAQKGRLGADGATLLQAMQGLTSGSPMDDREMLYENAVTMLANLPDNSALQSKLTGQLVNQLWDDLPHPPTTFLATGRFREADGSGNNPAYPSLGAAGTPYARSVPKIHPTPNNLPDPSVIFDALLKRDEFTPHPSGISSLLFSFATLIIHSAFETNSKDPHINDTSSYLDLSPLYGNKQVEQDTVRSRELGKLYPDVVASRRIMFMPPSVFALLVTFSRHHNFIAEKLAAINEGGRFSAVPNRKPKEDDPDYEVAHAAWKSDPDGKKKQDEELFQTARLINCGFFANVIFMDYIRVILNVSKTESLWSLTPTNEVRRTFGSGYTERGTGNACAVEFNILYRWHSAISAKDEKWLENFMFQQFGKPMDQVSPMEFGLKLKTLSAEFPEDRKKWTHGNLVRNEDGSFEDADLVKILTEATDEVAGAFGARKTPAVMKLIDVLGMATARNKWNTCSLNEFRRFLNLKPFTTFDEWNSDKEIARVAEQLYVHPDNLELFVGLQAEEAKPSRDGSGLAPGYTVSRAILSDAVALVRGDRFFTTDYNAATLTAWGFEDVTPDPAGGSYGGVIGKILMRAFPTSYTFNSIYALFPFSTPATTRSSLESFGKLDRYNFLKPSKTARAVKAVHTYDAVQRVLLDTKTFGVNYSTGIEELVKDHRPFFIGTDNERIHMRDRAVMSNALFNPGWQDRLKAFYTSMTAKLIKDKSWSYDGGKTLHLDVVRDVTNMTAVHWVSWAFGIPIKTEQTPHALFTPKELYGILSAFFCYVFMNFDVVSGFKLRTAATSHAALMQAIIGARLAQTNGTPAMLDGLAHSLQKLVFGNEVQGVVMGAEATSFYRRILRNSDRPLSELNSSIQCTMTASVSNQGQALAQVINFYLDPVNAAHYQELVRLSKEDGDDADNDIRAYIYEALRLDPQVPFCPRVCKEDAVIQDGQHQVHVKAGDYMYPSIKNSGRDENVYPRPNEVDIKRDPSNTKFRGFGFGMHECLGARVCHYTLVAQIREVFKLKNVRRAPGPAGQLQRIWQELGETQCPVYITSQGTLSPLPQSLAIIYDSDI